MPSHIPFFLVMFKDKTFQLLYKQPKKEKYKKGTMFFRVEWDFTVREIWENLIKEFPNDWHPYIDYEDTMFGKKEKSN